MLIPDADELYAFASRLGYRVDGRPLEQTARLSPDDCRYFGAIAQRFIECVPPSIPVEAWHIEVVAEPIYIAPIGPSWGPPPLESSWSGYQAERVALLHGGLLVQASFVVREASGAPGINVGVDLSSLATPGRYFDPMWKDDLAAAGWGRVGFFRWAAPARIIQGVHRHMPDTPVSTARQDNP